MWSDHVTWECSARTGTADAESWEGNGVTCNHIEPVVGRQLHTKEGSIQRFPPKAALALMTLALSQRARVATAIVRTGSGTAGRFDSERTRDKRPLVSTWLRLICQSRAGTWILVLQLTSIPKLVLKHEEPNQHLLSFQLWCSITSLPHLLSYTLLPFSPAWTDGCPSCRTA